jgi:replicative DNA helicase
MSDNLDLQVLKGILSDKRNAFDFITSCDEKVFSPDLWQFSKAILSYIKTFKNVPTLDVLTLRLQKGNNQTQIEYLKDIFFQLDNTNYNDKEYHYYYEQIKVRFANQQIIKLKDTLANVDPSQIDAKSTISSLQKVISDVKGINQVKAFESKSIKDAIPEFVETFNGRKENPDFDSGIKTGYKFFDEATGGLKPGELILIGGETSSGKSMLMMNMAINIWRQNNIIKDTNFQKGYNILYFSFEMPYKPCLDRVLSNVANVSSKRLKKSKLEDDEMDKLKQSLKFIKKYPNQFQIVDVPRGATMQTVERIYEETRQFFEPDVIVTDYLGIMDCDEKDKSDWEKLSIISAQHHEFARTYNKPVISAVQLNRVKPSKDAEERIGTHRVGRSSLILHHANIALQIETRPNEKNFPDMYVHLIKNRDGMLTKGRLMKNFANSIIEDDTDSLEEFQDFDSEDLSSKLQKLELDI